MSDELFNRLRIEINKTYYTSSRYKVEFTFALLYHKKELSIDELGDLIRVSDIFFQIDDEHYFINFAFTEQDGAFKASQNLIVYLDKHFQDFTSCIAIDTFDKSKTPKMVLNRLKQILHEIKRNPESRIEDDSILNKMI